MSVKRKIQFVLHRIFGVKVYLFCFGIFSALRKLVWPEPALKLFVQLVEQVEGDILDVGSNVGTYSIYFAKKLPARRIVAFEPQSLLVRIQKQIMLFFSVHNCRVFHTALGHTAGELQLVTPMEEGVYMHGLSHIVWNDHCVTAPKSDAVLHAVTQQRLDDYYMDSDGRKIAAIKIDVENHELFVVQGAQTLLELQKPILMVELWENDRKQATMDILKNIGYQAYVVVDKQIVLAENRLSLDYLFIHKERSDVVNLSNESIAR